MRGKRLVDVAGAGLGLIAAAPVMAAVAAAIRLSDGGPVFFRQTRVGRHGVPFRIWKFRTMVQGAEGDGPSLTMPGDRRVTRVGAWLRRIRFDELPQLFNILAGEMSFVGPRPEVPKYVALYDGEQRMVLELVPGLTDPASLSYRNESELLAGWPDPERAYAEQIMPVKIRLSLEYARRATVWSDLRLVATTLGAVFGAGPPPVAQLDRPFPGAH
jgi:lipopolysaccharide/colanic/teichoic acid biosynthesis glycosyltransferase